MKTIILIATTLVVAYGLSPEDTQSLKSKYMKMGQECQGQTGANPEDINLLMKKTVPTRKEGKCLIFCVHKKIGFQDESGKKDAAGINGWLDEMKQLDAELGAKAKQVADQCIPTVDDSGDGCEVAGKLFECYIAKSKEVGMAMMF